jgi:hypothetical protein
MKPFELYFPAGNSFLRQVSKRYRDVGEMIEHGIIRNKEISNNNDDDDSSNEENDYVAFVMEKEREFQRMRSMDVGAGFS